MSPTVIVILIMTSLINISVCESQTGLTGKKTVLEHATVFDHFCEAEQLYKPYVHYYKGRQNFAKNGQPVRVHPPNVLLTDFNLPDMENTYVCVNGLTWMYYANTTDIGHIVYHQPELHMFIHNCFLTNYANGPDTSTTSSQKTLMAILLMGDPNDYRKPHMTLMHAPSLELIVQDDSSTPVIDLKETENKINATSMFIFGDDTECILVKGKKKTQIRIRTGALNVKDHIPDEVEKNDPGYLGYEGTFCKLSYPHINTNLDLVEGASTPPKVEDQQARVSYALEALAVRNGEDAVVSRCENPDNYTNYTKKLVTERKEQIVNFTTKGDEKELLDPDLLLYFNKSGRLPEADPVGRGYTTVNKDVYPPTTDPCVDWTVTLICYDLPSPPGPPPKCPQPPVEEKCEKLNNCSACDAEQIERVVKIHKLNVEAERTNPDPAIPQKDKDDKAQKEREKVLLAKLLLCRRNGWTRKSNLTEVYNLAKTAWEELEKNMEDLLSKRGANSTGDYYQEWQKVAAGVAKAETLRNKLENEIWHTNQTYRDLIAAVKIAASGGDPKCADMSTPLKSDYLVIKRDKKEDYIHLPPKQSSKDTDLTLYPSDVPAAMDKTCGMFPKRKEACINSKPETKRACQLLKARMANWNVCDNATTPNCSIQDWKPVDSWRGIVLQLLADIFSMACSPMIKAHFALNINRVIKGYLIDFVKDTLPYDKVLLPGNCTTPGAACPQRLAECVPQDGPPVVTCTVTPLPEKRPFWDEIIQVLEECKRRDPKHFQLKFKRIMADHSNYFVFLKQDHVNGTSEVELVYNVEQADQEFSFNYAIDSLWRIFATVLGICMPHYETKIPLITSKFYAHFSQDFLSVLVREWTSARDNPVFGRIFGEYYEKLADFWSVNCMEASFMNEVKWRPPRKLMVNGGSQLNYFIAGPLAGTYGNYN